MNANAPKNRKLIKQYPFLAEILSKGMEPNGEPLRHRIDNLSIKVERADGDLMYRQADNCGLGENSFVFSMKSDRKEQVMRRGEYLFAVDNKNEVLSRLDWPRNEDAARKMSDVVYSRNIFWAKREGNMMSQPFHDKVQCLVWITVNAWYKDTKDDSDPAGRFGKFLERNVAVVIYRKPAKSFYKLEENSNVYENLYLTSKTLMDGAVFRKNYDFIRIDGMLGELCKLFQDEVFFNGMQKTYDAYPTRGAAGTFGSVKVMVADMCGYHRVQLEDALSWVSLQLRPEASGMYTLGMGGTLPQIRNLVKTVVKIWNNSPDSRSNFKSNPEISVM